MRSTLFSPLAGTAARAPHSETVQLSREVRDRLLDIIKTNDRLFQEISAIYAENPGPSSLKGLVELAKSIEEVSNIKVSNIAPFSLPLILEKPPLKIFAAFAESYRIAVQLLSEVKDVQARLERSRTAADGSDYGVFSAADPLLLWFLPPRRADGSANSLEGNPIFDSVKTLLIRLREHLQQWQGILERCTQELLVNTDYKPLFELAPGASEPQAAQTRLQWQTSQQLCGFIQRLMKLDRKYDPQGTRDVARITDEQHRHKWLVVRFCIEQLTTVCVQHSLQRSMLLYISAEDPHKEEIESDYFISGPYFRSAAYGDFVQKIDDIINEKSVSLYHASIVKDRVVQTLYAINGKQVRAGGFSMDLSTLLVDLHYLLRDRLNAATRGFEQSIQSFKSSHPQPQPNFYGQLIF